MAQKQCRQSYNIRVKLNINFPREYSDILVYQQLREKKEDKDLEKIERAAKSCIYPISLGEILSGPRRFDNMILA